MTKNTGLCGTAKAVPFQNGAAKSFLAACEALPFQRYRILFDEIALAAREREAIKTTLRRATTFLLSVMNDPMVRTP